MKFQERKELVNKIEEGLVQGFNISFKPINSGLYYAYLDNHKLGIFDEDDVQIFIKLKLDFISKFKKLIES